MREKIDLHSHSKASDGALTPTELVKRAKDFGLTHLALTDHDTLLGIDEALEAGREYGVQIIPGIEISTTWNSETPHIVGLFIDPKAEPIVTLVNNQRERRDTRARRIGEKLEAIGFENAYERTKAQANEGAIITRGNYARFLYSTGKFTSTDEAFSKYLKRNARAYVKSVWDSIEHAVTAIHNSGGVAVLAHPRRYNLTNMRLRALIEDFVKVGGDAMEVASSQQKPTDRDYLAELCLKYNLLASCGSDFHMENQWRDLGLNLALPKKVTPVWRHERARAFNFPEDENLG